MLFEAIGFDAANLQLSRADMIEKSLIKALRAAIHRLAGLSRAFRATVVTAESPDRPWFHTSAQWSSCASITEQHTAIGVRLVWGHTG